MNTTVDTANETSDDATVVINRGDIAPPERRDAASGPAATPPRRRLRRALLFTRTLVVVVALLAAAVIGGTYIVRQRLAEQMMVDAGTAVLTAQPITVGSADAAVVTRVLVTERQSVDSDTLLATITLTADGGAPRVQELKAPAAGIVTQINVAPGQIARAGEPIITLYDPAKLEFDVDVPLPALRKLRLGMTAYVTGPGLAGRITTTLQQVKPRVDADQSLAAPDRLTVVLRPDPAALTTVRTLVPGLRFDVIVDTNTAVGKTPAVNSA